MIEDYEKLHKNLGKYNRIPNYLRKISKDNFTHIECRINKSNFE